MARPGNTLSPAIRSLWDGGNAGMLTKTSRTKCSDAHVSIIGHIVRDELRREMTNTELANGFANRFLFVCSRRSKLLPDGGGLPDDTILASSWPRPCSGRTPSARGRRSSATPTPRALWHEVYAELSEGRPGLLGAVTSRAEAQVMRLATIYAVLDGRTVIGVEHLRAALEVWRYCEASARYIFGDALGDPVADEILAALRNAGEAGMTRTEIREWFQRHRSSQRISQALAALAAARLARMTMQPSGGRPTERWWVT